MGDLTKNFSRDEFECKCGECGLDTVDYQLLQGLQIIRDTVQRPVEITSGFRCQDHNNIVGGNKNSYHLQGKAADIMVEGYTAEELADIAEQTGLFNGIGIYDGWIHVDVRSYNARWRG